MSSGNSKADYDNAFGLSIPDAHRTSVIIMTPESFLGNEMRKGVVDQIYRSRLQFIVIDEANLMYEWSDFRGSFKKIGSLKKEFPNCPIMALGATLTPSSLQRLKTEVLRDPVVIKGNVDRRNVAINNWIPA